jgi:hypothetical protein
MLRASHCNGIRRSDHPPKKSKDFSETPVLTQCPFETPNAPCCGIISGMAPAQLIIPRRNRKKTSEGL